MLHILWVILKIILIVIGILLGLLLLALLLLLFCPVRYGAQASGDIKEYKKAQASVTVSWLFRGVLVKLWFSDGKAAHSIRLFGVPLEKLLSLLRKRKKSGKREGEASAESAGMEKPKGKLLTNAEGTVKNDDIPQTEDTPETAVPEKEPDEDTCAESDGEKEDTAGPGLFERIRNKISGFLDKLKKIPEAVRSFTSKLHGIYDKIDYWKQFLSHPRVKDAISFAWQHVKTVLKHVFPTRLEGHVTFGSEDPSVTGGVLAVLGMTMGFHKNCIEAHPVFEGENLLYGDIKLRGRVYGFVIVKAAVQIYFNKNIKYVINRWKHKEESL